MCVINIKLFLLKEKKSHCFEVNKYSGNKFSQNFGCYKRSAVKVKVL